MYYILDIIIKNIYSMITNKSNKPNHDYLNPVSSKYYLGYRYECSFNGTERWYDKNNIIRKEIVYHPNGNKRIECYYNEKSQYHNEHCYAWAMWFENATLIEQLYYINGCKIEKEDFLKLNSN